MNRNGGLLFCLCFCLHFSLILTQAAANPKAIADLPCNVTSCRHGGPSIKFPFRLASQPKTCGIPGFVLSCSQAYDTLMNLTLHQQLSIQFVVKHIDYSWQEISLAYPENCLPKYAQNLSSLVKRDQSYTSYSSSLIYIGPFTIDASEEYSMFRCPPSNRTHSEKVPCLSKTGTSDVYAIPSLEEETDEQLTGCTKIKTVKLPDKFFSSQLLNLTWTNPACRKCEQLGQPCGIINNVVDCIVYPRRKEPVLWQWLGPILRMFLLILLSVGFRVFVSAKLDKAGKARIDMFLQDYRALNPARYSYADLKRITGLSAQDYRALNPEKLGQGAHGTVYKGKLSDEIFVAVKMLANTAGDGDEFINEVGTIGRIRHVNIVRLVGFCAEGFHRALVYEFLPNESLEKFIYSGDDKYWEKLEKIALGIARGVEYLHQGCDRRILHFDIKPHNVLLNENFSPKVSDFGLAKLCSMEASAVLVTAARGTLGYIAPEVFSINFGKVSYKSDVYSFGMLLLEMVGGRRNNEESSLKFFPRWVYTHLQQGEELSMGIENPADQRIARKLTMVGLCCIQWHPEDRPSMNLVVQMLEGNEELMLPANPFPSGVHELTGRISQGKLNTQLEVITEDPERAGC